MDNNRQHQNESTGATGTDLSVARIAHVALLNSLPLYWTGQTAGSNEHPDGLNKLFEWLLNFSDAQFGISTNGIGHIVRSIYTKREREPPKELYSKLGGSSSFIGTEQPWEGDDGVFGTNLDWLYDLLVQQEKTPGDYVWVDDPSKYRWWIEATIDSLKSYSEQVGIDDPERLEYLFNRHRCVLFASTDCERLLERVESLIEDTRSENEEAYQQLIDYCRRVREEVTYPDAVYWSWRLINFRFSRDRLIYLPSLALWSDWPSSAVWAPPRPPTHQTANPLQPNDAADLLEDVLLKGFGGLFSTASHSCGLGQAAPTVSRHRIRSPVFYFVTPVDTPSQPKEYVEKRSTDIEPIARKCLGFEEPPTKEADWGVWEDNLVTLRRDVTTDDSNFPCYLLLPVGSEPEQEVGNELNRASDRLAHLEFTQGDGAEDVHISLSSISERQPSWEKILNEVNELTTSAIDFLPSLSRWDRVLVYEDFRKLHVLQMMRVRFKLQKEKEDFEKEVEGELKKCKEDTKRRLQHMPLDPLPIDELAISATSDTPFPYRAIDQDLTSSTSRMELFDNSISRIERLSTTAATILETADQRARELLGSRTSALSLLVGFLALIGLAEFIPATQLEASTYPSWLSFIPFTTLVMVARVLIILVGLAALFVFAYYLFAWAYERLPFRRKAFSNRVQDLWACAELAGAYCVWASWGRVIESYTQGVEERANLLRMVVENRHTYEKIVVRDPLMIVQTPADEAWNKLEQLDKRATRLLQGLWKEIGQVQNGHRAKSLQRVARFLRPLGSPQIAYWLRRNRNLQYHVDLFALCPEIIPLSRTLCIFRYKNEEPLYRSMFSDQNFRRSLEITGFNRQDIDRLNGWLSEEENIKRIRSTNPRRLGRILEKRGVKDKPADRAPEKWVGPLE